MTQGRLGFELPSQWADRAFYDALRPGALIISSIYHSQWATMPLNPRKGNKMKRISRIVMIFLTTLALALGVSTAAMAADPTLSATVNLSQDGTTVNYSVSNVQETVDGATKPVPFSFTVAVDGAVEYSSGPVGSFGSRSGSVAVAEGANTVTLTIGREQGYATPVVKTLKLVWPLKTVTPTAPSYKEVDGANNDVVTPPTITGAIYDCTAWTNGTKTCKATPAEGYKFPEGAQTTWTFTDKNTQPEELGNDEDQEEPAKPRDPKDSVVVTPPASKPAKPVVKTVVAPASNSNTGRGVAAKTGVEDGVDPLAIFALGAIFSVVTGGTVVGARRKG